MRGRLIDFSLPLFCALGINLIFFNILYKNGHNIITKQCS